MYIEGRQPAVHLHWRRFKVSSIPLSSLDEFDKWLQARWQEKDAFLEEHERTGSFPSDLGECFTEKVSLRFDADLLVTCAGIILLSSGGIFVVRLLVRMMGLIA